jgi:magnesium-protoporphyrin O-methyltransferase
VSDPRADVASSAHEDCDCPADPRIARFFDRRAAARQATGERYAMGPVSKTLLAALREADPRGRSVLELGCGPGALLTELLTDGARSATGFDLSTAALTEARARTVESGVADRATFVNADAARSKLPAHEWVVLDKVICCYPDPDALVGNSIAAAERVYAFALPASYGWPAILSRLFLGIENTVLKLVRRPCPGYVHDVRWIERRLRDAGFTERSRMTTQWFWHVAIFERPPGRLAATA